MRSQSETINPALPSPPVNHVPHHQSYTFFESLRGFHSFSRQLVSWLGSPSGEDLLPSVGMLEVVGTVKNSRSIKLVNYYANLEVGLNDLLRSLPALNLQ